MTNITADTKSLKCFTSADRLSDGCTSDMDMSLHTEATTSGANDKIIFDMAAAAYT